MSLFLQGLEEWPDPASMLFCYVFQLGHLIYFSLLSVADTCHSVQVGHPLTLTRKLSAGFSTVCELCTRRKQNLQKTGFLKQTSVQTIKETYSSCCTNTGRLQLLLPWYLLWVNFLQDTRAEKVWFCKYRAFVHSKLWGANRDYWARYLLSLIFWLNSGLGS